MAKRHAALSPANIAPEGFSPYQFMGRLPPPTPPAPFMISSGALPLPLPASLLGLPPPPPPPSTDTSIPVRLVTRFNTAPSLRNPRRAFLIDTSRPPPPLGPNVDNRHSSLKRTAESCEAGPSKTRKQEGCDRDENYCENCFDRVLRTEVYKQTLQKLEREKVCQTYILERKSDTYDSGRLLLKSVVGSESFKLLDEFIEALSSTDDSEESPLFQAITALSGRDNKITSPAFDLPKLFAILKDSTSTWDRSLIPSLAADHAGPSTSKIQSNSALNELRRLLNGKNSDGSVSTTADDHNRYASGSNIAQRPCSSVGVVRTYQSGYATSPDITYSPYRDVYPVRPSTSQPYTIGGVASTYHSTPPLANTELPSTSRDTYMPYPHVRPYNPHSYGSCSTTVPTNNYNSIRAGFPQTPAQPSFPAPPLNSEYNNPYCTGRYPTQYYPNFK